MPYCIQKSPVPPTSATVHYLMLLQRSSAQSILSWSMPSKPESWTVGSCDYVQPRYLCQGQGNTTQVSRRVFQYSITPWKLSHHAELSFHNRKEAPEFRLRRSANRIWGVCGWEHHCIDDWQILQQGSASAQAVLWGLLSLTVESVLGMVQSGRRRKKFSYGRVHNQDARSMQSKGGYKSKYNRSCEGF